MMGIPSASRRAALAALVGVAALGSGPTAAWAQGRLREGLMRGRGPDAAASPLARYVSEQGRMFILDRSQGRALLKYEDSPEIWALAPMPAPRGDTIYKNDMGEPVLRATRLGGFTLFSETRPNGEAVSVAGVAPALRLPVMGPQALAERLVQASYRAGRVARRTIVFQAEASPASSALIGDAAVVTTLAIGRIAQRKAGAKALAALDRVYFEEGRKTSAGLAGGILRVVVSPADGVAGRPSSQRIERAILKPVP